MICCILRQNYQFTDLSLQLILESIVVQIMFTYLVSEMLPVMN